MRNVKDLFVFFQSVNSKELFQLIKNNVDIFALRNYSFGSCLFIKIIKVFGQPENQVVYMV